MRYKLDENVSSTIAGSLTEAGHDTATVAEQGLAGAEVVDQVVYHRLRTK